MKTSTVIVGMEPSLVKLYPAVWKHYRANVKDLSSQEALLIWYNVKLIMKT